MKNVLILFFLILQYGCIVKNQNPYDEDPEELIKKIKKGDIDSYEILKLSGFDLSSNEFADISKFLIDSLNYKQANFDILTNICYKYQFYYENGDTIFIDKMSKEDRIKFLKYTKVSKSLHLNDIVKLNNLVKFRSLGYDK